MRARYLFLAVFLVATAAAALAKGEPLDLLGRLPVLSQGRVMPLDSLARLAVWQIAQSRNAAGLPPLRWLAGLLFDPGATSDDRVFFIGQPNTPAALGLGTRGRGRYSLHQLQPGLDRLYDLTDAIARRGDGARDAVEADLLHLRRAVDLYSNLRGAFDFARPDPRLKLGSPSLRAALGLQGVGPYTLLEVFDGVQRGAATQRDPRAAGAFIRWWSQGRRNPLLIIPPVTSDGTWSSPESALLEGEEAVRLVHMLVSVGSAWQWADWAGARTALEQFAAASRPLIGRIGPLSSLEVTYNRTRPFLVASLLALAASLLWIGASRRRKMWPASRAFLGAAMAVYAAGLVVRIILTGRPPVTSLYSSFLFVALLLLVIGFTLSIRRPRLLWPVAAPLGAIVVTALSSKFGLEGDQLGVLQAVLDSNFWLSTHVVAITTGYAASLAAGLIGHAWLVLKIARPSDGPGLAGTTKLLERTLLLALLFTFLGTILGGIWADQSWGRFWGWDPKEDGALLIILWVVLLQHARLSRMIDDKGLAVGSVLLVVVVLFSWLGVNLMGAGLHSYGWIRGVGAILIAGAAFETAFVVITGVMLRRRDLPMAGLRRVRVTSVVRETADAVTVTMAASGERRFASPPGRFLTVYARIGSVTYRRAYSFSSVSPSGLEAAFTVRRVQGGKVSSWIVDTLRPGAKLLVGGPSGQFGLDGEGGAASEARGAGAVFVASGSGIAPLAAMAEQYLRAGSAPLLILYGSRDETSIIFRERLEALGRAHPQLTVRHVLSEPSESWRGERGWIDGGYVLRLSPAPEWACLLPLRSGSHGKRCPRRFARQGGRPPMYSRRAVSPRVLRGGAPGERGGSRAVPAVRTGRAGFPGAVDPGGRSQGGNCDALRVRGRAMPRVRGPAPVGPRDDGRAMPPEQRGA